MGLYLCRRINSIVWHISITFDSDCAGTIGLVWLLVSCHCLSAASLIHRDWYGCEPLDALSWLKPDTC
jgi:hypothetical protein